MLALYPSNKLEHLSFLLTTLLRQQPLGVFTPETILVESPGMQHWVSMQMANEHGVAMNIDYPLPVRFMWNTARTVLGADKVPKQSPYRREVLTWRIDNVLQDNALMDSDAFEQVNKYWQSAGSEQEQGLQRLQLATALADVYEQYLLYRPDWLFKWENNERAVFDDMEVWQSEIWRILAKDQPLHPARLHQMTLEALEAGNVPAHLPKRVIVFAINTMAPQLIAFFDALAQHIDIHIFHLNPSVNYWGEAKSSSEQAKLLRLEGLKKWMEEDQSNPLLGNLGKQGRELFNLLTELDTFEISAFDSPDFESAGEGEDEHGQCHSRGLLDYIHNDILQAAHPQPLTHQLKNKDDSVTVMCTHSALREVQVLHDHLLHWLSQDKTRTPSDILVMCPAIENYAPFVDAVFHRVGTKSLGATGQVRLPCTIADRSPMDAEPLIAAFMALLQLPDSRFGVSDILDYLQLDSVQKRFSVSQDDIEQMVVWLKQAHIHWGLNSAHKTAVSEGVNLDDTYSWWWGIRRLLMGMLAPDSEMIVSDVLTIPDVEGQSALTLGKLIEVVALLGEFAQELTQPRPPEQWSKALIALRDACFMPTKDQQQSWDLIAKVAADLAARCEEANYEHELTLRQVRDLLLNRFSSPDAGNHFMTGQVTVCSMLPMRSIPFKKVCILGLNDSEFPRKSSPLGLDLMASDGRRVGDRSRRLEDRYLFLEAIISTRESLYLSYQGNDVTNNSERQPSLVLAEFMDMLENNYALSLEKYAVHAPLHPFSEPVFAGALPSYETGWLRLADALQHNKLGANAADTNENADVVDTSLDTATADISQSPRALATQALRLSNMQIARAFKDPLEHFSIQRLGVNLSQSFTLLENSEPFETNALLRYQVLDAIFSSPERNNSSELDASELTYSEQVITFASLRGDIPNNPVAMDEVEMWKEGALALSQAMGPHDAEHKKAQFQGKYITFTTSALEGSDALVELCAGKVDAHRALGFFISQLIFSSSDETTSYTHYPLEIYACSWEKGETILKKQKFPAFERETAVQLLLFIEQLYMAIYTAPTPVHLSLFGSIIPGKRNSECKPVVDSIKPEMFGHLLRALLSADNSCETDKAVIYQVKQAIDEVCPIADNDTVDEASEKAQQIITQAAGLFDTVELQRSLTDWQQSSGQYSADMANNPYLNWLFPQGINWSDVPHLSAFLLLAMVNNASQEEKL